MLLISFILYFVYTWSGPFSFFYDINGERHLCLSQYGLPIKDGKEKNYYTAGGRKKYQKLRKEWSGPLIFKGIQGAYMLGNLPCENGIDIKSLGELHHSSSCSCAAWSRRNVNNQSVPSISWRFWGLQLKLPMRL